MSLCLFCQSRVKLWCVARAELCSPRPVSVCRIKASRRCLRWPLGDEGSSHRPLCDTPPHSFTTMKPLFLMCAWEILIVELTAKIYDHHGCYTTLLSFSDFYTSFHLVCSCACKSMSCDDETLPSEEISNHYEAEFDKLTILVSQFSTANWGAGQELICDPWPVCPNR